MRHYRILTIILAVVLIIAGVASANSLSKPNPAFTIIPTSQTSSGIPTSSSSTQMVSVSSTPAGENCLIRSGVQFCIKGISTDDKGTHVLLETKVNDQGVRLLPRPYLPPEIQEKPFFLVDDQGQDFRMVQQPDASLPFDVLGEGETGTSLQTLHFVSLPLEAKLVTLHIPAIAIQIPLSQNVKIDVGLDPKNGDRFQTNSRIQIGQQTIDFVQAEILAPLIAEGTVEVKGDVASESTYVDANQLNKYDVPSLRLKILSAPIIVSDQPNIMTLLLNGEDFPVSGAGFDKSTGQFEVEVELLNPKGELIKTGEINVPITGASLLWQDLQLSWDMTANR